MAGIIDFDICFPAGRADVHRMHAASGLPVSEIQEITVCAEFPALAADEASWELALRAADTVLQRSGVAAAHVRYVIYAGSGQWDRPFWSPAAKVAQRLGITRAHCFEVTNFCNAAMTALRIAIDKIELGAAEYALVLTA